MKTFRIAQTADLHLGSHFSSTPEIAAARKAEQLENLRNIINAAHEAKAAALLICGDLFDTMRVEAQLLAEVQQILRDCGMYVFISPGNHDPATPDSSYMHEGWSENVHIFKGALEGVELENEGVCIWGAGFRHSVEAESLLYTFIPRDKQINILMMHGEVVPNDAAESRYNPVTPEKLASLGVDYCALGHIHKPSINSIGEFCYCNAGCPSGRGFDEQGERGIFCGYVSYGFSHMTFTPIPGRRYQSERVNVTGCSTTDDFCNAIKAALEKNYGSAYKDNIYDVTLRGSLAKGIMPDTRAISKLLMQEIHYVRVTDMTTAELDINTLMKDGSLRGAFVRTIISRMEKDVHNRNLYQRALLYGLRAFDGEVRVNEDY